MPYEFRQFYIPDRMMPGIRRYIDEGIKPGHFLTAIICNDSKEACALADNENLINLPAFAAYFYNEAPAGCFGSGEKMHLWIEKFKQPVG